MPRGRGHEGNGEGELIPVSADELRRISDKPLAIRPYRQEEKSPARATAEWRRAAACALSFEDKVKVFRVAYQLAEAGHMPAINFLAQYGMGKPGVGSAGKLVDDVTADALENRLARLPPEMLRQYLDIVRTLQGDEEQPSLPAPTEEALIVTPPPEGTP